MTSTSEPRRTGVRFKWCRPTRGIGFRTSTSTSASSLAVARSTAVSRHSRSISKSKRKNEKRDRSVTSRQNEVEIETSGEQEPFTYGFNARFSVSLPRPPSRTSSSTSGSNSASPRYLSRDNSPASSSRNASPETLSRAASPMNPGNLAAFLESPTPSPELLSRPVSPEESPQSTRASRSRSSVSTRGQSPVRIGVPLFVSPAESLPAVPSPAAHSHDDNSDSQTSALRAESPPYQYRVFSPPVPSSPMASPSPPRSFSPTLAFLATQLATPSSGPPSAYSPFDNPFESVNTYPSADVTFAASLVSGTYPPFDAPFAPSRVDPFASMPRDNVFSSSSRADAFASTSHDSPFETSYSSPPLDSTSRDTSSAFLSRAASPAPSSGSDSNASTWSAVTPMSSGSESLGPSLRAITAAARWSPAVALPVWSADCPAPSWNAAVEPAWSTASRATPWNGPGSMSTWSAASHANHWSAASQRSHWNGNSPPFLWDFPPPSFLWSGSSPASLWSGSAPLSLWNNSSSTPWRAPYAQYKNPQKNKRMKAIYKSKKPLTLACHTSEHGVASVLTRNLENGDEYEVSVDMRTFLVCERTYTDVDKGVAAVLFGIRKCHKYLTGRAFTIITDQEPLIRIFDPRRPMPNEYSPRYIRAAIALMSYHYDIMYRPVSDLMPDENENNRE